MGTDIWIGMFDTPCEEEEREKEEVGEPAIKKREATKIEKKKMTVLGLLFWRKAMSRWDGCC